MRPAAHVALAFTLLGGAALGAAGAAAQGASGAPAAPVGAAADADVLTQARRYFEAGKQAYDAGRYGGAIAAFAESFRLAPRTATVFSLAQAYRLDYFQSRDVKKLKRAIDLYQQYLREERDGARRSDASEHLAAIEPLWAALTDVDRRRASELEPARATPTQLMVSSQTAGAVVVLDGAAPVAVPLVAEVKPGRHTLRVEAPGHFAQDIEQIAVEGRLVMVDARLEAMPGRLVLDVPSGAEVRVGATPVGEGPIAEPIALPAGRYRVTVSQLGRHSETREVVLERAGTTALAVELETTTQRYVAYGVLGAAALFAGGGVATTLGAFGEQRRAEGLADRRLSGEVLTLAEAREYDRALARREGLRSVSIGLYGVSLAAAVAGLLLYTLDQPRAPDAGGLELQPLVGPGVAGVGLGGRLP